MIEDPPLESPQALARLEAELRREGAASLLVGLQRLGLPPRAVEGEHQLAPGPLAQRLLGDQLLQLDDELVVASELELGLDPLLPGGESELVESRDLRLREVRVAELQERRATPEGERLSQLLGRALGLAARAGPPRLLERVAEDVAVERAALDAEAVSLAARLERSTRRAEGRAQP